MKLTQKKVEKTILEWARMFKTNQNSEQRLGQYLMNELCPLAKNSEIFYDEDNGQAVDLFIKIFVGK